MQFDYRSLGACSRAAIARPIAHSYHPAMAAMILDSRRYLTDFDSTRTGNLFTDVLVIGTGVAGSRAALAAAEHGTIILMTKAAFDECATQYAQGGVAAALADTDSPAAHRDDTLRVGGGLNRVEAVERLVQAGPDCVRELIEWGIQLDHEGESLSLTREGGHRANRIAHDHDQTGKAFVKTLADHVRRREGIRIFENCFMIDLLTRDEHCVGAVTYHERYGHQLIWAKQTILAAGGCGQVWRETTNPPVATGDGLAAAYRAGARLSDLEMMQFHPTTLYIAGAGRALISEAVRGEGAFLVDRAGERFMHAFHPDMELAPRDVVSRSILRHMIETDTNSVYLDVRHIAQFKTRFPHIAAKCAEFGIDVSNELIPVRPSAHYMIGGVEADLDGTTSLDGLLACGEASCSGVHGANRLASNSLLEGLVYGKAVGQTAGARLSDVEQPTPARRIFVENPTSARTTLDLGDIHNSLRSVMWRNAGIARTGNRLQETIEIIDFWSRFTLDKSFDDAGGWELQNMLTVARMIAASAAERNDSAGVHHRLDHPQEATGPPYHVKIQRAATDMMCWRATMP